MYLWSISYVDTNEPITGFQVIIYYIYVFFHYISICYRFHILSYLEKDMKTKCVVEMEENQTILYPPTASMNKADPR